MLETLICACFTLLPDYLFRRYVQGKRIGHEITFFSMWYELRWGLVTCFMAATTVITLLFYYHPSTTAVTSYFRTVTILPQTGGRVDEVYVSNNQDVAAGDPIFRLESSSQQTAVDTAKTKVEEVEAQMAVAQADLEAAEAGVEQAEAALAQSQDELNRQNELLARGSSAVRISEVERLGNQVNRRIGELDAAKANQKAVEQNMAVLIPAQQASALAALEQAEAELAKTLVVAGVSGRVEQFNLQVGDYVSPVLRPAGILVPTESGHTRFQAGFNQLAAGVLKPGMIAEMGCMAKPFEIVPMVIVAVQDVIPSGQFRPSDNLQDPLDNQKVGSITVFMEPLYDGGIDHLLPGSKCIAMAYTNNHELLENEDLTTGRKAFLHTIDTIGVVHAAGLRLRMLMLPVTTLVFSGH